ncbi:MAG: Spy/CpxP family protein refolding chaperone [Halieaceae bacterium]|jgi:Spy/CpxP family protein refolding chaperone
MLLKNAISSAAIVLCISMPAVAGADGQGRMDGEERFSRMQKHLDLTDEQITRIREIRETGGGREEIRAVFTDEQREKIKQRRGDRSGKHSGPRGDRGEKPEA